MQTCCALCMTVSNTCAASACLIPRRLVLGAHKAALYATRSFWKQLLHSSVQFNVLTKSLARIEACRNTADRTYKTMLERYPSNIKVGMQDLSAEFCRVTHEACQAQLRCATAQALL